jgi:hypothetical protein
MKFDCHFLFMSLEYHNMLNFVAKGSKGFRSGKVAPFGSSHATKAISIKSHVKWKSCS